MMVIENKFNIGEIVYLIHDPEQLPRMIIAFEVSKTQILYFCSCGEQTLKAYDYELSKEIVLENKRSN